MRNGSRVRDLIVPSRTREIHMNTTEDACMNSRIIRPLTVVAFALSATALGVGTASADVSTATPVAGSVEVCIPIPVGPVELSFCL